MMEVTLVHAEVIGGDLDGLGLKFNAIRKDGGEWLVFASARDYGYWILLGEMQEVTHTIALTREWAMLQAKWSVLYGDPWNTIWDDPERAAADHVNAIEGLGDAMADLIANARLDDISDWRRELEREPPTQGEVMREHLTTVPLLAGRN